MQGPKRKTAALPPKYWSGELERVLISEERIGRRVRAMARQIERDYAERELVIVALLNGTIMFLADLVRHLQLPLRLDFMGVSSYGSGTTSRELAFTKDLKIDVRGRHVLLVDDILDTGRTVRAVSEKLRGLKPKSLKVCVFLEKKARRMERVKAHYAGFQVPDVFVVGYGLDYAERYRHLPFVGVLQEHIYAK